MLLLTRSLEMFILLEVACCPFDLKCEAISSSAKSMKQNKLLLPSLAQQRAVYPPTPLVRRGAEVIPMGLGLLPSLCYLKSIMELLNEQMAYFLYYSLSTCYHSFFFQQPNSGYLLILVIFLENCVHISLFALPRFPLLVLFSSVGYLSLDWPEHFWPNHKSGVVLKL